ncbi:MAG: hypothetical protein ABL894_07085 [Hyphomicrobium sp.]
MKALSMSIGSKASEFYGPLDDIRFYGPNSPPKYLGYVNILGRGVGDGDDVGTVWIDANRDELHDFSYGFACQLSQSQFGAFSRMVERHFGQDIIYIISFDFRQLLDNAGAALSSDDFFGGKACIVRGVDMRIVIRPGGQVRLEGASLGGGGST